MRVILVYNIIYRFSGKIRPFFRCYNKTKPVRVLAYLAKIRINWMKISALIHFLLDKYSILGTLVNLPFFETNITFGVTSMIRYQVITINGAPGK